MSSFDFLWQMLVAHGAIPNKQQECARLWSTFNLDQQRAIYRNIRDKIRAGKFVHYNPVQAVRDNTPKPPRTIAITADQYYSRYHTQENRDGWVRTHIPEEQRTVYIKKAG